MLTLHAPAGVCEPHFVLFDVPAMGADTDFATSVAFAGHEVLYQPLAVVYHQEGNTFGTDEDSELKHTLMAHNKQQFFEKWKAILQVLPYICMFLPGCRITACRPIAHCLSWLVAAGHALPPTSWPADSCNQGGLPQAVVG